VANVAPTPHNVLRVRFNAVYGNASNIMNRLFYTYTGVIDAPTATGIATTLNNSWTTHIAPLVSTTYILDTITVTDLGSNTGVQIDHPSGVAGSEPAADFLPATTCMLFVAQIGRRYRGGKPRWYQTGQHQASLQDNQTWNTTLLGNWETAFNALASAGKGLTTNGGTTTDNVNLSLVEGYTWTEYTTSSGNVNYRKDPTYRTEAVTDIISDWQGNPRVSNQRKRGVN
jgi:hypothetical protein